MEEISILDQETDPVRAPDNDRPSGSHGRTPYKLPDKKCTLLGAMHGLAVLLHLGYVPHRAYLAWV